MEPDPYAKHCPFLVLHLLVWKLYRWASSRDIINQMQWSMLLKRIVAFILWAVQLQMYLKDKWEYKLNNLILATVCISYGNRIP